HALYTPPLQVNDRQTHTAHRTLPPTESWTPPEASRLSLRQPARPGASSRHLLRNREDPDHATLRHVLLPAEKIGEEPLLEGRVDAPARHDADVLCAVDREG